MRRIWRRAPFIAITALLALGAPASAFAGQPGNPDLRADLNGKTIPLIDVGRYHCHDFDYPRLHCFVRSSDLEVALAGPLSTTALDYVLVYEYASFAGASLYISSNYTVLATIGWNDRVSSFKGRNSISGRFWTDWFYGGTSFTFCCNQQYSSLGGFDDTFSSVHRL